MRKRGRVTSILIFATDIKRTNNIVWTIRRVLPEQVKFFKPTTFGQAERMINHEPPEIFIVAEGLANDNQESIELESFIELTNKQYPKHPIIALLKNKAADYQINLHKKHRRLQCVTTDWQSDNFKKALRNAYDDIVDDKSRYIKFQNVLFSMEEAVYFTVNGDYVEATLYDYKKATLYYAEKKISMKKFIADYNEENILIRCHASYCVNRRMIKGIDPTGHYLILLVKDENGDEIQIPISTTYRKHVLDELEGLY